MRLEVGVLAAWAPDVVSLPPRLVAVGTGGVRHIIERRRVKRPAGYGRRAWEQKRTEPPKSVEAHNVSHSSEIIVSPENGQRHFVITCGDDDFPNKTPLVVYNGYNTRPKNASDLLRILSHETECPVYGLFPPGYAGVRTALTTKQVLAYRRYGPIEGFRQIARSQAAVVLEKSRKYESDIPNITGDSMGAIMGLALAEELLIPVSNLILTNPPITQTYLNRRVAALLHAEKENISERDFLPLTRVGKVVDIAGILVRDWCLIYGSALAKNCFVDMAVQYLKKGGKFHHIYGEYDELNNPREVQGLYAPDGAFYEWEQAGRITCKVIAGEGHACMTNPWLRGQELRTILNVE